MAKHASPREQSQRTLGAWRRIDKALVVRDPKLGKTLRPGLRGPIVPRMQMGPEAWFRGHDGQRPGAAPLIDDYRLLSLDEAVGLRAEVRGRHYRPDWNDSWVILGQADVGRLFCVDQHSGAISVVDVRGKRFKATRKVPAHELLERLAARLEGAAEPAPTSAPKRIPRPKAGAGIDASWAALRAHLVSCDEADALAPPPSAAARAKAAKTIGAATGVKPTAELEMWLGLHDGQPFRADNALGKWRLLSTRDAERERRISLEVAAKIGDAGYWVATHWPLVSNGAGDLECLDLASGKVMAVYADPYLRKVLAPSLASWFAKRVGERIAADAR